MVADPRTTAEHRPLAVVTGASSGIGRHIAKELAGRGFDLVVVADGPLADAVAELRAAGAEVTPVAADLSTFDGVEDVARTLDVGHRAVDVLALNAGIGLGGDFVRDETLEDALGLVNLNVVSTVHLAKRVLPAMVERGGGRVLFTSSIAAMTPGPFQALYNASKSFIQSFAEAIADELGDTGVTVTSLMPGPTDTDFFDRADLTDTKLGASDSKDDPADVARKGVDALMDGRRKVVAGGVATRAQAAVMKMLPDSAKAAVHRRQTEPGSAG